MTAKKKPIEGIDPDTLVLVSYKDGSYTETSVAKWGELYADLLDDYQFADEQPAKLKVAILNDIEWKLVKITQRVELV